MHNFILYVKFSFSLEVQMPREDVRLTRTKHVAWSNQQFTQQNARLILLTALLDNVLRWILFLPVAEYVGSASLVRRSQFWERLNTSLFDTWLMLYMCMYICSRFCDWFLWLRLPVLTRVRIVERYANSFRCRVTVAEVCRSKPKLAEVSIVQTATNSARTSNRTHPVTITLVNFLTLFMEIIVV
jgi:hypothetical protein